MRTLVKDRHNVFSQNGEDGVLAGLLHRLGIHDGWFCEFGAWDGKHLSNTYALLERGWRGVMMEGESDRYSDLASLEAEFAGRLYPLKEFVSSDPASACSLDNLLDRTPIPAEFEVLSVDIDGDDLHVWSALQRYRPIIVIIEANSRDFGPWRRVTHRESGRGSSFAAVVAEGQRMGYAPVAHTGNVFFVRSDRVGDVGLGRLEVALTTAHYRWALWGPVMTLRTRLGGLARRVGLRS